MLSLGLRDRGATEIPNFKCGTAMSMKASRRPNACDALEIAPRPGFDNRELRASLSHGYACGGRVHGRRSPFKHHGGQHHSWRPHLVADGIRNALARGWLVSSASAVCVCPIVAPACVCCPMLQLRPYNPRHDSCAPRSLPKMDLCDTLAMSPIRPLCRTRHP